MDFRQARKRLPSFWCAEHVQQLGGASPLPNLLSQGCYDYIMRNLLLALLLISTAAFASDVPKLSAEQLVRQPEACNNASFRQKQERK